MLCDIDIRPRVTVTSNGVSTWKDCRLERSRSLQILMFIIFHVFAMFHTGFVGGYNPTQHFSYYLLCLLLLLPICPCQQPSYIPVEYLFSCWNIVICSTSRPSPLTNTPKFPPCVMHQRPLPPDTHLYVPQLKNPIQGRPGLVVTRVNCNKGIADKTDNANYSARRQLVRQ